MINNAEWIWLGKDVYPENKTAISFFDKYRSEYNYTAAEFEKRVRFGKRIAKISIEVSADVRFWLYVNGDFVGVGPACAGGDYANTQPMPYTYYNVYDLDMDGEELELYAMVHNKPTVETDMSRGRCGFILACRVQFADGSEEMIYTDETWSARVNAQRTAVSKSDFTAICNEWRCAEVVRSGDWSLRKTPIFNLCYEELEPQGFSTITLAPGECGEYRYEFDKIYPGYYRINVSEGERYSIEIRDYERFPELAKDITESVMGSGPLKFQGLEMKSLGAFVMNVKNTGTTPLVIDKVGILYSHYPTSAEGDFNCSEEVFNKIYSVGKHALKICRQTLELDSPKHQENLGCVGDYHIASLMNYFAYGDTELTRFDIVRIGDYLEMKNGKMFHTTYSMIWILMVLEYYRFTADKTVLTEIKTALEMLLERFEGYVGERGVIDNPPDYMFVDWLIVDGISMHHPPMCLGQSVLNAFYYGGLRSAAEIFAVLGDSDNEEKCKARAEKLYTAFNKCFYDEEKHLYFDGLNDTYNASQWLPENTDKRYFSWHTNSLAALFGLAEPKRAAEIMEIILNDMTLINPQPYFMHFVIEAIYKTGLFEKYGLRELRRWECMADFDKGLQEGWYAPGENYRFDYSHVWCGTPTYQLPSKLMGFEMVEAGFGKVRLKPNLYGLEYADIKMPTPFGDICVKLREGSEPEVTCENAVICKNGDNEYILEFNK